MAGVAEGRYRIPQFQREFVWPESKVRELFDSIYREFPIGSFFLWKAGREQNQLFRHVVGLGLPPVGKHDDISFILDGQQRITSLYVTLYGLTVNGTDYSRICFDLKEEKFTSRTPDNKRYVAVCDLWGARGMQLSRGIEGPYVDSYVRCWTALNSYPVSVVEVRDKGLEDVCKIFQRINQSGKRLDRFDLISAMTFTKDFDLRAKFTSGVVAPLEAKLFGGISPAIVTQLLALMKTGQCTQQHEYALTADDIQGMWTNAVNAVLLAAETLRNNMGVANYAYLPYDAQMTLLSYYFAKSGHRSLPQPHMEWVLRWFWRSAFGVRYAAGGATRVSQDSKLFDQLIAGGRPEFAFPIKLGVPDLCRARMTLTGSAVRNAFLCMLARLKPLHLVNNGELDLVNGGITGFTTNEKHHIFPISYLQQHGPSGADIHVLPNFCFLPAELNKRIRDAEPARYMTEFRAENPQFDRAVRSHLLPTEAGSGVPENDYLRFLQARGEAILIEIKRLCGGITTPKAGEQQGAIEALELTLRDGIDQVLVGHAGRKYWKTNVPLGVREAAEKRIEDDIEKHPDVKRENLQDGRRRLDYCNVTDYLMIIENAANWPAFEGVFRKKDDVRRYLASFSEYRNVVMHNREMAELVKLNGEAALLWLTSVLGHAEGDAESEEVTEGESADE